WLLAESGEKLDEALNFARVAKDKLGESSEVLDTMGWIYYKKGAFPSALDLFKQCVRQDTNNPTFNYQLGMTNFKIVEREHECQSLSQAIKLNPGFPGSDEAKSTLAKL